MFQAADCLKVDELKGSNEEPGPTGKDVLDMLYAALLFENPLLSVVFIILGLTVALVGDYFLQGKHSFSFLTAVAYILLLDIALSFGRGIFSAEWREQSAWLDSSFIKFLASKAHSFVLQLAAVHDDFLLARDPQMTLRVVIALWAVTYLARTTSMWRLLCLSYFSIFAISAANKYWRAPVQDYCRKRMTLYKEASDKLGIKRQHKAILLVASLVLMFFYFSWTTIVLAVFTSLVIVRCHLKIGEVDAISQRANDTCVPYMRSAKKQVRRFSVAASDVMRRSSFGNLAKTHNK